LKQPSTQPSNSPEARKSPQPAKANAATEKQPIIIAGAGPAGLFMGLCLAEKGFEVQIFEKRTELISDSRSLGIHPPSLRMLEKLGILNEFLKKGIEVPMGWAHDGRDLLGSIDFSGIDQKPSYILIHPQNETEKILKQAFIERMPKGIQYGASIESFTDLESEIALEVRNHQHELRTYHTPILISCDGKNSTLREAAAISYEGHNYPDTYLMGDFPVVASDPKEPVVYITQEGLVESFPLPDGKRRWVAKTEEYIRNPEVEELSQIIKNRTHVTLEAHHCSMISSFGVQHRKASKLQRNRFFLVGDAAHVVSPIGGQGMNLGWLGAWQLSEDLASMNVEVPGPLKITNYQRHFYATIKEVAKRAEWNMKMGRKSLFHRLKVQIIRLLLSTPLTAKFLAVRFTMSGLSFPKLP